MITKAKQILDSINLPSASYVSIDVCDIAKAFDLEKELIIKEFQLSSDESFKELGDKFAEIIVAKNLSKFVIFFVVADLKSGSLQDVLQAMSIKQGEIIWGCYEPKEGECDRVVAIMQ